MNDQSDLSYWRSLLSRGRCQKCSATPKPCRRCKDIGSLPDPDVTARATGWTFEDPTSAVVGPVFVSYSEDRIGEDGGLVSGLDSDATRAEEMFGTASITSTEMWQAVRELEVIVGQLPRNYPRRAFLVSWVECGGFVDRARKEHQLTYRAAHWAVDQFFETHPKLSNPWKQRDSVQADPELCADPNCTTTRAHSPHAPAGRTLKPADVAATPPKQIADKNADRDWKRLHSKAPANDNGRRRAKKNVA